MRINMRRLWEALTDAEREIVMAASAGHSAETAGRILGLAPKTVNNRAYEIAAKWRAIQAES
jgi:DNA-binding CsgD family transcriptional regulator